MSDRLSGPRSWRIRWEDVNSDTRLAWFQATRRAGSAPRDDEEVVAAADYDALAAENAMLRAALAEIAAHKDCSRFVRIGYPGDWHCTRRLTDIAKAALEDRDWEATLSDGLDDEADAPPSPQTRKDRND